MKLLFHELHIYADPCLVFKVTANESISLNSSKQPHRAVRPLSGASEHLGRLDLSKIVLLNVLLNNNFEEKGTMM